MESRERILSKAHELYFRYGIRSVTMDEIAGQCGVSKKTIYQFFEDKDALVDAVMDEVVSRNQQECLMDKNKSENAVHEIFLALDMVMKMFSSMNPNILLDLMKHHPKTYTKLEQHKGQFLLNVLKENIRRGKEEGLYREDIHEDIISRMRLATTFLPFDLDLFPKGKYSLSFIEMELTDHYLYGLVNAKGHKFIQRYKQERSKQ